MLRASQPKQENVMFVEELEVEVIVMTLPVEAENEASE